MTDTVGIRELRHNAAEIIGAAEAGQSFRVTIRGKDTGVYIAKQPPPYPTERRRGLTLDQIRQAGLHTPTTSDDFQETMLAMVERGRDADGRVGDHTA